MNRNGRQGRNHDQHGPTERELKMIALDEAGMTADEIGAEMGLRADYVERRLIQLSIFDTPRVWPGRTLSMPARMISAR